MVPKSFRAGRDFARLLRSKAAPAAAFTELLDKGEGR
jgi:hypothetical protein